MPAKVLIPESEELFRLMVNQISDYAIFLLTPAGDVASWNTGAERLKGYKAEEILGRHFRIFYPPEKAENPTHQLEIASATGRCEDEGWRVRKDGSRFWANVVITPIRDGGGSLIGFAKVTRDLTERKKAEELLRELSGRLLKMQDEERKRIGTELHDSVGQYLAAVKMSLDGLLAEELFDEQHARKKVADCLPNIEQAIREVRTLSYLLYPPMLQEIGLASAIRWHLDGFSKRSGIQTTYEISADLGRLPDDVELALFRVLQESLTNVHRHSGSKTVHIRLAIKQNRALLEIKDSGRGMPPGQMDLSTGSLGTLGVGIRGMRERVRQLGGELTITSTSEGTTVKASIPVKIDS